MQGSIPEVDDDAPPEALFMSSASTIPERWLTLNPGVEGCCEDEALEEEDGVEGAEAPPESPPESWTPRKELEVVCSPQADLRTTPKAERACLLRVTRRPWTCKLRSMPKLQTLAMTRYPANKV